MAIAQRHQITLFLVLFKQLAQENFIFVPRKKCLDTLGQLGITIPQAKSEIMSLTVKDYYRGPIPDGDKPTEEFWEFGKKIDETEIFIRLKAVPARKIAMCHSFHPCEKEIKYPYKGDENK